MIIPIFNILFAGAALYFGILLLAWWLVAARGAALA